MKKLQLFVALILSYVVALWVAAALPAEPVRAHIEESLPLLERQITAPFDPVSDGYEPLYRHFSGGRMGTTNIDYFCDALMLNQAWNIDPAHPFTSPLENRHGVLPGGYTPTKAIAELAATTRADPRVERVTYERYWHGYLVLLRPLLEVCNYLDIKRINLFCLGLLGAAVVIVLARRKGVFAAAALAVALTCVNFWVVPLTLQYAAVFYIALGASLVVLLRPGTDMATLLMVAGSLAAFFDFLTAPLLTLGLPLAMWMTMQQDRLREAKLRDSVKRILRLCLIWAAGYAGTWLVKGIIAGMVAADGLAGFFHQIASRMNGADAADSALGMRWVALRGNLAPLLFPYWWFLGLLAAALAAGWIKWRRRGPISRMVWLWLLVAAMPIGWYLMAANHSFHHSYMTYRVLLLSVFGILMAWRELVEIKKMEI